MRSPPCPSFAEAGPAERHATNPARRGSTSIGTSKVIIDRISAEIEKLVALPDTKDKLEARIHALQNPRQTAEVINAHITRNR